MSPLRRLALVLALGLLVGAATGPLARAELSQRGDLFVSFQGGLLPRALPRDHQASIAVSLTGRIRTLSGERPPALRRIEIGLGRGGRLDTRGLPVCRPRQVLSTTARDALAACAGALVGRGAFGTATAYPDQRSFPSSGGILAFNSVLDGQRAILAHVYGTDPVPNTRLIVFRIRSARGAFGTVLRGALPPSLNRWGYLRRIVLRLHRDYRYRGRSRSYLSATCAAPPGLGVAIFPFAKATMSFDDGRQLTSTLMRSCRVATPT